jgi:hypothetical protein
MAKLRSYETPFTAVFADLVQLADVLVFGFVRLYGQTLRTEVENGP